MAIMKEANPKEKVERNKKIFALWKTGLTYFEIAKAMDTTPSNVGRIINRHKHKYG